MAIENLPVGEITTAATGGGILFLLARKLIKGWFSDQKDVVMTTAETQLYKTLAAENSRMAQTIEHMSIQVEKLVEDNNLLKNTVAELGRQVQASNDWEQTAKELQEELKQRDIVIAQIARRGDYVGILDQGH